MPLVTRGGLQGIFRQANEPGGWVNGDLWVDTDDAIARTNKAGTATLIGQTNFARAAVVSQSTTIGDYTQPTSSAASSDIDPLDIDITKDNQASNSAGFDGPITLVQFTGLTVGIEISSISLNVVTAAGNVRIKVYDDNSDVPDALLAESGSLAIGGTGIQKFALTSNAIVPSDGIIWASFEVDSSLADLKVSTVSNGRRIVTHTYGAGPDPIGSTTTNNTTPWIRITHIQLGGKAVDDNIATAWESDPETNPNINVDMGAVKNITALAIHLNANNTETQIKIRVSSDQTFTDSENVRTIIASDLTAGAWNFIRFNIITSGRFVQIFGSSGSSLVMSFNEIKYLTKTDAQILEDFGILEISTSDTSLDLDGT